MPFFYLANKNQVNLFGVSSFFLNFAEINIVSMKKFKLTTVLGSTTLQNCVSLIGGGKSLCSLLVVLAVFFSICISSCTSDDSEEEGQPTATRVSDLNAILVSHDWEVTEASSLSGIASFNVLNGRTHCKFSYNTISFSREEMQYSLNGTPKGTTTVPAGEYSYAVKEGVITIDNQIFVISIINDDSLVLLNEGWKVVLKGKVEGMGL